MTIAGGISDLQPLPLSWSEGICPFHGKACLSHLCWIRGRDAGELCSDVVDDVEIAVGPVVVPEPEISADRLGIRRIHLKKAREGEESVEGVVALEACQHDGEMAVRQRQSKAIPGLRGRNGKLRGRAIVGTYPKLVQCSIVVSTEAFIEIVGKAAVLAGPVGQLVTREVVDANRNEHILINVE